MQFVCSLEGIKQGLAGQESYRRAQGGGGRKRTARVCGTGRGGVFQRGESSQGA